MRDVLARLVREESGHVWRLITGVLGAVAALLLAAGAAGGRHGLIWIGGILVALAFLNSGFVEHVKMDYPLFARVDRLEGKK
jgi:uncharacterized membrane protein HdeD (DUF308 family)